MLINTQKRQIKEIEDIIELFGLNYQRVDSLEQEAILPVLRSIKDHYIRGQIVLDYTFIDELLSCIICKYFCDPKKSFIKSWKTKKFKNFNYFIEKLYLLNKLDLVDIIIKVPKLIDRSIRGINDLRNGLAHSFFPENLRRNKPIYKKQSIYTLNGLKKYLEDRELITNFLFKKAYQIDISGIDFNVHNVGD